MADQTDLQKIEARDAQWQAVKDAGTGTLHTLSAAALSADCVKLARALDTLRKRHAPSGSRQRCLACGLDGNCCSEHLLAERVLREVAGE